MELSTIIGTRCLGYCWDFNSFFELFQLRTENKFQSRACVWVSVYVCVKCVRVYVCVTVYLLQHVCV